MEANKCNDGTINKIKIPKNQNSDTTKRIFAVKILIIKHSVSKTDAGQKILSFEAILKKYHKDLNKQF